MADFDLAIIGGGINGAGIARDAAGRGLSVGMCEKGDLGEGTSSRSGKLIHGGLRYLEQWHFSLVRKALQEREVLLASAPTAGGRIVNIAARPGLEWRSGANMAAYAASKAAVAALTVALAEEVAKDGILVNAVAPSIMDTPANRAAMPKADYALWPKVETPRAGKLPPAAEMVVEKEPGAHQPSRTLLGTVWQHETQWPDDMRRDSEQHLALDQCLAHQPELVIFEIAQAAVHELA